MMADSHDARCSSNFMACLLRLICIIMKEDQMTRHFQEFHKACSQDRYASLARFPYTGDSRHLSIKRHIRYFLISTTSSQGTAYNGGRASGG